MAYLQYPVHTCGACQLVFCASLETLLIRVIQISNNPHYIDQPDMQGLSQELMSHSRVLEL